MDEFEKFKAAVYGQESGNGAVPTDKPNYAGARGKGQILEATFKGLQKNGAIPANYEWSNPVHNEAASDAYMAEAWQAADSDPRRAAAYYYGGPKAIKGGGIVEFGDRKNAKAPTTVQYAEQVASRMGLAPAAPAKPTTPRALSAVELGIQRTAIQPSNRDIGAELQEDRAAREAKEAAMPTFGDIAEAAFGDNTDARIFGAIKERIWGEEFPAERDYHPDYSKLNNLGGDATLLEDYTAATSSAAADKVIREFKEEQERSSILMSKGAGIGIAASFGAELASPTNWVMALAAPQVLAVRGLGSVALASQGASRSAVIASSVAENLVGGTALEATAQLMEGRFKGVDLLVSGVADTLLGAGAGSLAFRAINQTRTQEFIQSINDTAVTKEAEAVAKAQVKLGPDATTEQVVAEVQAARVADVNEPVRSATQADAALSPPDLDLPAIKPTTVQERVAKVDAALTEEVVAAYNPGVHLSPTVANEPLFKGLAEDIKSLSVFLPKDHSIVLTRAGSMELPDGTTRTPAGVNLNVGNNKSVIAVAPGQYVRGTVAHEVGHSVDSAWRGKVDPKFWNPVLDVYQEWYTTYTKGKWAKTSLVQRGPLYRTESEFNPSNVEGGDTRSLRDMRVAEMGAKYADEYYPRLNEFMAESFNKHVEAIAVGESRQKAVQLSEGLIKFAQANMKRLLEVFKKALRLGMLAPDTRVEDYFAEVFRMAQLERAGADEVPTTSFDQPATVVQSIMTDPDANRFGLGTIPVATKTERDEAKAILNLHKNAEQKAPAMTADYEKKVKNLADNSVFNVASTGLIMLKSQSPLVRWIAGELLEDASGVQVKRGATAAIKKHLMERQMMGNVINEYDSAYTYWKKGKPGGWQDDLIGGKNRAEFDRTVAAEIEARRLARGPVSTDPSIKGAADVLEAAYTRTAKAQVSAKTLGSEGLPPDSIGYMPHRMSAKAVLNLTNEQRGVVHQALVDQFITIEGWDASFSDMLASRYLQRVTDRATGGNASSMSGNSAGAVDLVEEALNAMALPADEIKKHMDKFKKGGANYTKGRIELDLNKAYPTASGEFKLLDIFETNQIELIRSQVQRASGDVALTLKGVQGKPGLQLLRKAMQFGEDGKKATTRELEAFDQIAAEFLGEPFGTATPRWMERAMSANTLVRLGGIVFNQISESINGIVHVGAMRAMESVTGIPRLRQEILALARGEQVDNSIIGSIEIAGGAEFGTDAYKIVMPYDNPSNVMPTYGQDTLTLTDRLLRGGGHIQAKLSGWRAIHSAQQRGMAEQIVHKTLRYIREGKDDVALQQFGITPELRAAMRSELGQIAEFDASGRLTKFDVTKMTDPAMREQIIQAVWRGTSQIIQGTYIGERGKWAHDGTMKLLTQFRTFSITSMEKQWGRQRNSRGAFATFGIIMGAMSLAAPIYMARTYLSSVGRPDQEAYLEERFQPQHIARATMNYVANVGMAGDFIDGLSSMMPADLGIKATGGRSGVESEFVGNYVAPASSLVNDIWSYAQSPLELQDAAKILPMSRLPYLLPLMNQTRD